MKTSVELDEKKLALAKKLGNIPTTREVLDQALEAFIGQARRRAMLDLLGKRFIDPGYDIKTVRKRHDRHFGR